MAILNREMHLWIVFTGSVEIRLPKKFCVCLYIVEM